MESKRAGAARKELLANLKAEAEKPNRKKKTRNRKRYNTRKNTISIDEKESSTDQFSNLLSTENKDVCEKLYETAYDTKPDETARSAAKPSDPSTAPSTNLQSPENRDACEQSNETARSAAMTPDPSITPYTNLQSPENKDACEQSDEIARSVAMPPDSSTAPSTDLQSPENKDACEQNDETASSAAMPPDPSAAPSTILQSPENKDACEQNDETASYAAMPPDPSTAPSTAPSTNLLRPKNKDILSKLFDGSARLAEMPLDLSNNVPSTASPAPENKNIDDNNNNNDFTRPTKMSTISSSGLSSTHKDVNFVTEDATSVQMPLDLSTFPSPGQLESEDKNVNVVSYDAKYPKVPQDMRTVAMCDSMRSTEMPLNLSTVPRSVPISHEQDNNAEMTLSTAQYNVLPAVPSAESSDPKNKNISILDFARPKQMTPVEISTPLMVSDSIDIMSAEMPTTVPFTALSRIENKEVGNEYDTARSINMSAVSSTDLPSGIESKVVDTRPIEMELDVSIAPEHEVVDDISNQNRTAEMLVDPSIGSSTAALDLVHEDIDDVSVNRNVFPSPSTVPQVPELDPLNISLTASSRHENKDGNIASVVISSANLESGECSLRYRQKKTREINYRQSPINSETSDFDDSDADPDFKESSLKKKNKRFSIQLNISPKKTNSSGSSSSSSSTTGNGTGSACSCTSSSTDSSSDAETEQSIEPNQIDERNIEPNPLEELSTDTLQSDENEKKTRKRKRRPETWIKNKIKKLRNSGKLYESRNKKQKPARKLQPGCGDKCRLKCNSKISNTERDNIFKNYWNIADLNKQREFIIRHTSEIKPKYRYSSTKDFRKLNSAFYFEINGKLIRVCKIFFKATLDINDRNIKTALSKKSDSGFVDCDMRGKHGKQPTVDPEIKSSVRNFINSIPRIESHYLRAQTQREFIDSSKTIADLYRDYKASREEINLPFASMTMFYRIFNYEFNIGFFVPKKDQCDLCESYENADSEGKSKLIDEYTLHQNEKELARAEKENDKNNTNGAHVAVYDLQAVMPVPRGNVSSFYYKSKLNCYNFTVSDFDMANVECYFWNETEGNRGAIEIGSCLLHYINSLLEKTSSPDDLDIIFYSDNCSGQQKNKYIVTAYAYAVNRWKVKSITHKFLIRGHTQNEGDNIHSVIEKQITKYVKAHPIYVPDQYATLIRIAKKTGKPYHLNELTHDSFVDLKALQDEWGKNFSVDEEKNNVKWHDIKQIRVEKEHPYALFYKTSHGDTTFKKVNTRFGKNAKLNDEPSFSANLAPAYSSKIPLSANKKKDINDLITKNIIPNMYYQSYYRNIFEIQ